MISGAEYKMKIGDSAPDFSLKGTDGKIHSLSEFKKKLLVVFFTCNHCPYAKAYEGRIKELVKKFSSDADFVGINSNDSEGYPEDSFDAMIERARNKGFNFYYLRDETQDVAKNYGGECTPHFFVFDNDRNLQYQGRLDDNWKEPENVENKELENALISLSSGKKANPITTNAIGCSIKWKHN